MYLLLDIGGTRTRIALSEDGETFDEPEIFSTLQNFDEAITVIGRKVREKYSNKKIKAVVAGLPGIFDKQRDQLIAAHNLPDWVEKPIKKSFENAFKAEVFFENDTAFAGLGEAIKGAGKAHQIVAYLTVSTGIGGARVVDGKIDSKTLGFEPGHQVIDIDKSWFSQEEKRQGKYLDFGDMISGAALERRFGIEAYKIDDQEIWDEVARVLAVGLGNTILHWSPEVVVLGGGLIEKISVEKVKRNLQKVLTTYPGIPEIKRGELGDFNGLWGGLEYLKQKD